MNLSFEEKSAWGSLLAIVVAAWLFFPRAVAHIAAGGELVDLALRVAFVIGVIIAIEVVYHAVAAANAKDRGSDERDAMIGLKADRIAGFVLAFGVVWIAGTIMVRSAAPGTPAVPSSVMVSIYLLLALTASEASKLMSQIWFYRAES
jgi:hypothetical protein